MVKQFLYKGLYRLRIGRTRWSDLRLLHPRVCIILIAAETQKKICYLDVQFKLFSSPPLFVDLGFTRIVGEREGKNYFTSFGQAERAKHAVTALMVAVHH